MFNELKLAFNLFRRNWKDCLAISFAFSMIIFIGLLTGYLFLGLLLAFIFIMIPAIISLKFFAFQAYDKQTIEYRSLKVGFLTLFRSIKVYSLVILKPLLIGFLAGSVVYSFFLDRAIEIASSSIPNLMESLSNFSSFNYVYEEMLAIEGVNSILTIGAVVSVAVGYLIAVILKLRRDFIVFEAFEMPINSKRAIAMNKKILSKKNYFKMITNTLIILLLFAVPGIIAYLTNVGLSSNATLSPETVWMMTILVFLLIASPIITFKQFVYMYSYKELSKPFKEDFNNELQNVIKEMEELAKKINKNDK